MKQRCLLCTEQGRGPHKTYPPPLTVGDVDFGLSFSAFHICDLMSEYCNSITLFKINDRLRTGLQYIRKRLPVQTDITDAHRKHETSFDAPCKLYIFLLILSLCMNFLFDLINYFLIRADSTFR